MMRDEWQLSHDMSPALLDTRTPSIPHKGLVAGLSEVDHRARAR
jgi:hypothetical protein